MNKISIVTGSTFAEIEEKANALIMENQCHVVQATPFNAVTVQDVDNGKKEMVTVQIIEPMLVLVHS